MVEINDDALCPKGTRARVLEIGELIKVVTLDGSKPLQVKHERVSKVGIEASLLAVKVW